MKLHFSNKQYNEGLKELMVLNLNSFKYSLYCLLEKCNFMYVLVEFEQWHAQAAGGPSGDQNARVDLFSKSPGAQNIPRKSFFRKTAAPEMK